MLFWSQVLDKLIAKKVTIIWQIDIWVTAKLKTTLIKTFLKTDLFLISSACYNYSWLILLLSEKLFYKNSMACLQFCVKNSLFIDVIILILLWRVIHFQQIYLECMLLFAMYGTLHLTSVWLCMSVVFVVTVQWPIGTIWLHHSFYFLTLIPSAWVWKQYILQVTKPAKYLENLMTDNERVWNILFCPVH